jgi:SNF2 family DNA or RNA helicase
MSHGQDWSFQKEAIEFCAARPNSVITTVMGSGKSKMAIELFRMFGRESYRKVLVICPAGVLGVWRGQLAKHAPGEFDVLVLDGSENSTKKAELIDQALVKLKTGSQPLIVVVNYETASIGKFVMNGKRKVWIPGVLCSILLREQWNIVACDEIHRIKAHDTQSSLACWKIGKRASRRIGLTGTLLPLSPADIFGSYRFLDDTIFGRYVTHFRNNFAVMDPYIPGRVKEWKNQKLMQEKINSIRFHIDGHILTLPERQDIVIECPLSPKGMKAYLEMKKEAVVFIRELIDQCPSEIRDNPEELEKVLSASNAAVKSLRLLQLAQGYCTAEDGDEVDTDTQKRKMLLELIEQTDEPVCVYGYFKHDMRVVRDCCEILGKRYGEVSGARKDLTNHGTYPEDIDVLAVQVKSGSSGIDLTRARIGMVLNTGTISPGDYDQVMARQYRPGQTRNVVFYHLITPKTVDAHIQKARQEKRDIIHALLNEVFEDEYAEVF